MQPISTSILIAAFMASIGFGEASFGASGGIPIQDSADVQGISTKSAPQAASELSEEDAQLLKEIESTLGPAPAPTPLQTGTRLSTVGRASAPSLFNPALSLDGLFSASGYSSSDLPSAGAHDPQGTGFTLQNLELSLAASVDPYLRAITHITFTLEGVEVEEAYATTVGLPGGLQLKAGHFFTSFGRQNAIHPHTWQFAEQNMANVLVFGPDGLRSPGVQLSWLMPLPFYLEVQTAVQEARGETVESFIGEGTRLVNDLRDVLFTGRTTAFIPASEAVSVLIGASAANGPNSSSNSSRTYLAGADVYVKVKPANELYRFAFVQVEGVVRRYDLVDGSQKDGGFYVQAGARFARRWESALRFEDLRPDATLNSETPIWRERYSAQLTFRPSEFSKLRLEGTYDLSEGESSPVLGAILQFEFMIGAHGAHGF